MENMIGRTVGQYQITEIAGKGGMAIVYKAYQASLQRYVALKVLPEYMAQDEQFVMRFRQEALAAAALRHPNIMVIYDVGKEGYFYYIATEFLEGKTLSQVISQQRGPLHLPRIVNFINQVASALDFAHQRGVVHRDIKPSNVLIASDDHATLMDFGIAKALMSGGQMTRTGTMVGTPEYMSPEQAEARQVDHRSDIYSLGIVLYEMLTGRVPFVADAPTAILLAHTVQPPIPPTRLNPSIPPAVEAVVLRALAKRPDERFNSAGEMAQALAQATLGVPGSEQLEATAIVRPSATPPPGYAPATPLPAYTAQPTPRPAQTPSPQIQRPVMPPVVQRPLPPPPVVKRGKRTSPALIVAIIGVLVILGAAACVGIWYFFLQPPSVEKLLEQAEQYTAEGQYDKAITTYTQILEKEPENPQVSMGLGKVYEAQGDWQQATTWYEKWTLQAPQDANAFLALGKIQFNQGNYPSAVATYEQAEAQGANSTEMDTHLGLANYELAQYNKAVERLQKVIDQNQQDFTLQRALGLSLYHLDQPAQALDYLNKAATLGADRAESDLIDVYYALGSCYFGKQDYDQAISFYEKAQKLDPQSKATWAGEVQAKINEAYPILAQNVLKDAHLDLDFSNVVADQDGTCAIARTGQEVKVEGLGDLVDGPWSGSRALRIEEGTTNLVTNPSVEVASWGNFNKIPTNTRTSDVAHYGRYGMYAVCNAAAPIGGTGLYNVALSENVTHTASVSIKVITGSARLQVWREDWGASVRSDPVTPDDGWKRVSVLVPASYYSSVNIHIAAFGAQAGTEFYADAMQLEAKNHVTPYCDGDQGEGHAWDSNPHASTSARVATYAQYQPSDVNLSGGAIALWMKPGQFYNWPYVFGSYPQRFDSAMDANGYIYFRAYNDESKQGTTIKQLMGINEADRWHHIVYVWSQTAIGGNNLWLYIDGELGAQAPNTYWPTSLPANYAQLQPGSGRVVAKFMTFARPLTTNEARALYKAEMPGGK